MVPPVVASVGFLDRASRFRLSIYLDAGKKLLRSSSWLTRIMKKLIEYGTDDHPPDDPERAQLTWIVAVLDDCDECGDPRIELTVEEVGRNGAGLVGHLSPETVRRLRATLANALREIGEPVDA
jgi:hypothetical protein